MKSKGFTLIEMLIVIAVIGVLAIAVLSAINPVEQMRKARDTRRRSNAAELLNALERYYATNEAYPADYTAAAEDSAACADAATARITGSDLSTLIAIDELKAEFSNRINQPANELYGAIDYTGGSELAIVCYQVESQTNINKYSGSANWCTVGTTNYVCVPE